MIKKRKEKLIKGYHHIFYHSGGGYGVGECGKGYCCDDEYECLNCEMKIKLLSKPEGHFEMPRFFEGRHCCNSKHDKESEVKGGDLQ